MFKPHLIIDKTIIIVYNINMLTHSELSDNHVKELRALATIKSPLRNDEAERLVPVAEELLRHGPDMGLTELEVDGPKLVIKVVEGWQDEARKNLKELGFLGCEVQ